MKTSLVLTTLGLMTVTAYAIEYVTLTVNTPSRTVAPTDLVEVVGTNKNNYGTADNLVLTFADGATTEMIVRGKENGAQFNDMKGNIFTGLTSVALQVDGSSGPTLNKPCLTLKITPSEEIGTTPAGAVIVLPENATGDFNLVVECSEDLVNWTVFWSQMIDVTTSRRFFRTRAVKVSAP